MCVSVYFRDFIENDFASFLEDDPLEFMILHQILVKDLPQRWGCNHPIAARSADGKPVTLQMMNMMKAGDRTE